VDAMWANHLPQGPATPRPLESEVTAHTYYEGDFPVQACASIASILATQPHTTKVIVWTGTAANPASELTQLISEHSDRVTHQRFDFTAQAKGTPIADHWASLYDKVAGYEDSTWPSNSSTASDLVRYLVLHNYGGFWFDLDLIVMRDLTPLLHYELAYPWGKNNAAEAAVLGGVVGGGQNATLNGAFMRLFRHSPAAADMLDRVASEHIPFGLWGLSAMREDGRHADLRVLDVHVVDALWKNSAFFSSSAQAMTLLANEDYVIIQQDAGAYPNLKLNFRSHSWSNASSSINRDPSKWNRLDDYGSRFDWFYSGDPTVRNAGFRELLSSSAKAGEGPVAPMYHWHNRWDQDAQISSAYRLLADIFDCQLSGPVACSMSPK